MAITIYTSTPRKLSRLLKIAIESGIVGTWTVDGDGDYTPNDDFLGEKGWLTISEIKAHEALILGLIGRKYVTMTTGEYALFHTRFAELLLTHFDSLFHKIEISAYPTSQDKINT